MKYFSMTYTKKEKLGFRNLTYNNRHRQWGDHLTAIDIDMMEYDIITKIPVALIETKYGLITEIDLNEPKMDALCNLAKDLPVLLCVYYPLDKNNQLTDVESEMTHIQFYTMGVNENGRRLVNAPKRMTEIEYVSLLNGLRGNRAAAVEGLCDNWKKVKLPQITCRPIGR